LYLRREGKTVAKSFRVNGKALAAIQQEADRQNISLNTLVNQLLIDYSEFGRFTKRLGALRLTRKTFEAVLVAASEEALASGARSAGKSAPLALITAKWGKLTPGIVLEYVRDLSSYANLYEYNEMNEEGHQTITLMHELGPKWSVFLANYLGEAFSAAGTKPRISTSDRAVIFSL